MPAETDVINVGLRLIGAKPIISLSDGTPSANAAGDIYEELRDDMLRSHPWNFATKRVKLAQLATAPTFEFDHAYALPSDWLRTVSVSPNDAGHGAIVHRLEQIDDQRALLASSDQVYLRYIARVSDPNMMAVDFRRALAVSLARDLAIPLASSNTMHELFARQASQTMARARSADGMGSFPESRPRGSWAASRGGRRGSLHDIND